MDKKGVQLYPDQVGKIGAIFATRTESGLYNKVGRLRRKAPKLLSCRYLAGAITHAHPY